MNCHVSTKEKFMVGVYVQLSSAKKQSIGSLIPEVLIAVKIIASILK
jgi:hypothetical protein